MTHTLEGHHGTSVTAAEAILKNNYKISKGDREWLGDGAYFFVEGLKTNTIDLAEKWSIAESWCKIRKCYIYKDICVLYSVITVHDDNFLDLTSSDGIEIIEYLIDKFEEKIKKIGRKIAYIDGLLINLAREEGILPIEVVKGNFYIKFAKERVARLNLRTNNCTICAVYNPMVNVKRIKIVKTSSIK